MGLQKAIQSEMFRYYSMNKKNLSLCLISYTVRQEIYEGVEV
jgi:hypothetical protein